MEKIKLSHPTERKLFTTIKETIFYFQNINMYEGILQIFWLD